MPQSLSHSEMNFSPFHTVAEVKQNFDEEKVLRTAGKEFIFPVAILAAGDIAKCNGEEEWRERFLRLVGWLPDTGPQEPFFENLLELLSLREEVDYPGNAATKANLILRLPGKSTCTRRFSIPNWVNPSIS